MKSQTEGTWIAIFVNCALAVLGVLQGIDWVHVVGSQTAGIIVAVISAANVLAHYYTADPGSKK